MGETGAVTPALEDLSGASASPPRTRVWRSAAPVAVGAILSAFQRGRGDPTFLTSPNGVVARGIRTPEGPATLELRPLPSSGEVVGRSWGPGALWALDGVPELLGDGDDVSGFVAHHDVVRAAARRFAGWRVPRSRLVVEALVPAVIEQRVTGQEAFGAYGQLVRRLGEPAPGPYAAAGLCVPPSPRGWAAVPSWQFLKAAVDPGRSHTLVAAVRRAGRLEELVDLPPWTARSRMQALPGVGRWTSAEVAHRALGDADAVSFGDYHVAKDVTWALTGQALGDDALAEVLEPYAGHRYRVQRLLELTGVRRPRRGPRMPQRTHLPR